MEDDLLCEDAKNKNINGNLLRSKTEFSQGVIIGDYLITEIKKD
jgi:hypothetical protein